MHITDDLPANTYIVKITGDCNLYCPYCYHFKNRQRKKQSVLSLPLLEEIIWQAAEYSPNKIWFIWHGGEPLLAGRNYFERILEVESDVTRKLGTKFRNSVQTNGTLFTYEWARFLKENGFGVGISLDGPKDIHDRNRIYQNELGTFDQITRGVTLVREVGLNLSVICVVTKFSLDHEELLFNFFIRNGFTSFEFAPCVEFAHGEDDPLPFSISDEEYGTFMVNMFNIWVKNDSPNIRIRHFDNIMRGLLGSRPKACTFNGSCAKYVTVDNNGDVLPCDNFIGNNELRFGNLNTVPLRELLNGNTRRAFFDNASIVREECAVCEYRHACGGACRKYSYMYRENMKDPNYFCGSRKKVFSHVADFLRAKGVSVRLATNSNLVNVDAISIR